MMLTPLREDGKTPDGHIKWLYQCKCGGTVSVSASRVRNGYTRSCGCLIGKKPTHGMRNTPTYSSWSAAKDRATNKNSKDFYRYGAVGIGMSEDWMKFENFLRDMGERPAGTSLDRINPSMGYMNGNCRWATSHEQARNRKDVVIVLVNDEFIPLVDYAKRIGISKGAVHLRLKRGQIKGVQRV